MTTTVDQGRGILAFLGPLTGARATGKALVEQASTATLPVELPPNMWLSPVVNGALRPQMLYRVLPDYTNVAGKGAWVIPAGAGRLVDIEAHLGGTRYQDAAPAGATLRWADGFPPGLVGSSVVVNPAGGLTGADDEQTYGPDRIIGTAMYEALGTPLQTLELFRASLGACPAAMLIWAGTGAKKDGGRGVARSPEYWELFIIVDRADTDPARRGEGLRLLDAAEDLVLWRNVYGDEGNTGLGGLIVGADPSGVAIRGRRRLTGTSAMFQNTYVYSLQLTAVRVAERVDFRTFGPWNRTRIDSHFPVKNPPTDPTNLPNVTDNEFLMIQDGSGRNE